VNLPSAFLDALQTSIPAHIGTCSADGTPNATT
jgi:hypothetical protein